VSSARVGPWPLVAGILGSSLAGIDATAVNVVLPLIGRDFNASASSLQWVVEGYSLFLSALILVGGSFGDRFGRREIFGLGIAIFALASLWCGFAHNMNQLILARCVQGVGGALLTPGSLALISASYYGEERGRAIGTWSAVSVISAAAGPLLGGWLAQAFSWRYVFFINLPIAILVLYILTKCVAESRDESAPRQVDFAGAILATVGLGLLVYGLISLQGTIDALGLVYVGLGLATLGAFVVVEARSRAPMMPLAPFASRVFAGANLYTLLLYAAMGGSLYFIPFNLINVQGYSPTAAGAAMLPPVILIFAFSRLSGGLAARIGARPLLVGGALVATLAFVAYAQIGVGGSYWTTFFPASILLGIGAAGFVAPLTTAVMNAVPSEHAGSASGINNATARTAGLIAIALFGIVLAAVFNARFDAGIAHETLSPKTEAIIAHNRPMLVAGQTPHSIPSPERELVAENVGLAYAAGFRATMLASAVCAAAAALIAFWMLGDEKSRTQARPPTLSER
jgi:EmrB/QacA subfamily drug resistance transporter